MSEYDLVIVGAGPAGCAAALYADRLGLRCAVLERASFPREKACGGALSAKSLAILRDLGLYDEISNLPGATIRRIVFTGPQGCALHVDLDPEAASPPKTGVHTPLEGRVMARSVLDGFLANRARSTSASFVQGFTVRAVRRSGTMSSVLGVHSDGSPEEFAAPVVVGCDGHASAVARSAGLRSPRAEHPRHTRVALRQFFAGVEGLTDQIELHFMHHLTPGYFWIFPAGDGLANVGVGVDGEIVRQRHLTLPHLLQQALEDPRFARRFAHAMPRSRPAGATLPVASLRRPCHGEGVLIAGDAAGLIDPFTGEGIAHALLSGKLAVHTARAALDAGDTRTQALRTYAQHVWAEIGDEVETSAHLHRLARHRSLLDWVIRRCASHPLGSQAVAVMLADAHARRRLLRPGFYLRLLFG